MPNAETTDGAGRRRFRLGPGLLVTAAFIGPGTVVTASKAGAQFGCELLWTIVFACVGTIVLQSLAARLGILTGAGLGESIRGTFAESRWLRPAVALVIAAIGVGNAAYQTGNLTGAVVGISSVAGGGSMLWLLILISGSGLIVCLGRYKVIQGILVTLVLLLSLSFLGTAVVSMPPMKDVIIGTLKPTVTADSLTVVIGLIGTTIVPYNLFLHAGSAASTWEGVDNQQAIRHSDWDTALSVLLGGLVTAAIVLTANAAFFQTGTAWTSTDQIAQQLQPTLGRASGSAFAFGLFAAGLTSSITAPVATAYAVCGCLGWRTSPSGRAFRAISLAVIVVGGACAIGFGKSPAATILFAQVANGLLLPFVACFLLIVVRRQGRGGDGQIGRGRLLVAGIIVAAVALLGCWRALSGLI
ncbi:MAG: Nramp family divalent metal transporter [Planctomycetales bacterium]|nr:Nramp family divalent metal transporter [Planctomycetales bacterium]